MKYLRKNKKGFTLVELIVVIAIIVILTATLIPNVITYVKKASIASAKNSASNVYKAAQNYIIHKIAQGNTFEPNSNLEPSLLWDSSPDAELLYEPKDAEEIIIKINDNGTLVDYVYYKSTTGIAADYPEGDSGMVNED